MLTCFRKMKLKILSILLFTLFSVVIAFPGYGKSRSSAGSSQTSILRSSLDHSIANVLLKCLSIGINMVEEERTNEHQDDDDAPDEAFIPSYMNKSVPCSGVLFSYPSASIRVNEILFEDIFSPPDIQA